MSLLTLSLVESAMTMEYKAMLIYAVKTGCGVNDTNMLSHGEYSFHDALLFFSSHRHKPHPQLWLR